MDKTARAKKTKSSRKTGNENKVSAKKKKVKKMEMVILERKMVIDVAKCAGQKVKLAGFVHDIRDQSKVKFVLLRDITGIMQTVALPESKTVFFEITKVPKESVIEIIGLAKAEKQAPGGIEVVIESFRILSEADKELPILVAEKGKEEVALPLRLDYRWLDLRKPKNTLVFKIWTTMEEAMREYWLAHGFTQIYSPKIIGTPSEGGAEVFSMNYFGKKAYLAQSPQFYKQMAMSAGFEKVFEIGPYFRANPSHTTRHDTEFTGIDVEISFIESHEDIMKAEEEWIVHFLTRIKEKHGAEIKSAFGMDIEVPKIPFPKLTMAQAIKMLEEKGMKQSGDLDAEGEKAICALVKEKFGHEFVFITDYPVDARPFYHMRTKSASPTGGEVTKSFDLLWKGLEITTGAQREHRYEILKKQALEKGLSLGPLEDYLNFFKWGCPPHGGFGVSPTRLLMLLLGLKNVREATFLPRDTDRIRP
ncbi:MAG: aspartate--tRNA(Asn) ligase [archaeon]